HDLLFIAVLLENRDGKIECDGHIAELRNVQANAHTGCNAPVVKPRRIGDRTRIDEDHPCKGLFEDGNLVLCAKKRQPCAADWFIRRLTVVSTNALGADGTELKASQRPAAEIETLICRCATAPDVA